MHVEEHRPHRRSIEWLVECSGGEGGMLSVNVESIDDKATTLKIGEAEARAVCHSNPQNFLNPLHSISQIYNNYFPFQ